MVMWDWNVGHWRGLTDSEDRARGHVAAHIQPGETGRVEKVVSSLGYCNSSGVGWTAALDQESGAIEWKPLREGWADVA